MRIVPAIDRCCIGKDGEALRSVLRLKPTGFLSVPATFGVGRAGEQLLAGRVGARHPFSGNLLRVAVRGTGLFEDVDIEDAIGLGRVGGLGFDRVEDAGVDIDHAARRQGEPFLLEGAAGLRVELSGEHPFGRGVRGRRDAVAAWDDFQIAVAMREAVEVVENLHIVFVAFSMVDGVFMLPVVMVLVEGNRADAARRDAERGVAEVKVIANGGSQQRCDEGIVDQLVGVAAAVVPGAKEIGLGLVAIVLHLAHVVAHVIKRLDLFDQALPGRVGEDAGISDVAVIVKGFDIGRGRAR